MSLKPSDEHTKLPTVKGKCKDCYFLRSEWQLVWSKQRGEIQTKLELDHWCWICDIFKSPEGYCDMWELDEQSS